MLPRHSFHYDAADMLAGHYFRHTSAITPPPVFAINRYFHADDKAFDISPSVACIIDIIFLFAIEIAGF